MPCQSGSWMCSAFCQTTCWSPPRPTFAVSCSSTSLTSHGASTCSLDGAGSLHHRQEAGPEFESMSGSIVEVECPMHLLSVPCNQIPYGLDRRHHRWSDNYVYHIQKSRRVSVPDNLPVTDHVTDVHISEHV
jgi:hypothetical protein